MDDGGEFADLLSCDPVHDAEQEVWEYAEESVIESTQKKPVGAQQVIEIDLHMCNLLVNLYEEQQRGILTTTKVFDSQGRVLELTE